MMIKIDNKDIDKYAMYAVFDIFSKLNPSYC